MEPRSDAVAARMGDVKWWRSPADEFSGRGVAGSGRGDLTRWSVQGEPNYGEFCKRVGKPVNRRIDMITVPFWVVCFGDLVGRADVGVGFGNDQVGGEDVARPLT